ncbi:MAG: CoA pyrophosphatase [Planctomycetota bacterium]
MSPDVEPTLRRAVEALRRDASDVPEDVRHAAVALLVRGASVEELEVLLMKRAERPGDRWSGQIGLPGGHAEPRDADLVATARRESVEEVGVDPGAGEAHIFGQLPSFQARARGERVELYITPVVFHRAEPEPPTLGPEAAAAFWLPLELARSGTLERPYRYENKGVVHRLPSWHYEGHTIWGMTHGILSRFVGALGAD